MAKDERKLVIDAGHAVLVLQDNGAALNIRWLNSDPNANQLFIFDIAGNGADITFAELQDFITACAARRAAAALEAKPEPEPIPGVPGLIGMPGPPGLPGNPVGAIVANVPNNQGVPAPFGGNFYSSKGSR